MGVVMIFKYGKRFCFAPSFINFLHFRIFTSNFNSLIAISDPELAQQLYQNQNNMAHPWDVGMGHFLFRFIGKVKAF